MCVAKLADGHPCVMNQHRIATTSLLQNHKRYAKGSIYRRYNNGHDHQNGISYKF